MASTVSFTDNSKSPYFIHPGDIGVKLPCGMLTGDNYMSWKLSISNSLTVRKKLGFLTGAIALPSPDNLDEYDAWICVNSLLMSWLMNAISPEIRQSLMFCTSAKEIWNELSTRYTRSDGPRVFHFKKSLSSISKGTQTMTQYYNQFKGLWDELMSCRPVLQYKCGVMPKCTCNLVKEMNSIQENDAVMEFLVGLDETYGALRNQLLMQSPLPTLSSAYSLLYQAECQRNVCQTSVAVNPLESMVMLARNNQMQGQSSGYNNYKNHNGFNKDKKKLICTHCKFHGHTADKCFQVIGYPPGWKGPRGQRVNHQANDVIAQNEQQDDTQLQQVQHNPLLTQDLFQQFVSFANAQASQQNANTNQPPAQSTHHAANVVVSSSQTPDTNPTTGAGQFDIPSDWYC